jgi:hypothetical protein
MIFSNSELTSSGCGEDVSAALLKALIKGNIS